MAPTTNAADAESIASSMPGDGAATPTTLGESSAMHEWLRSSEGSGTAGPFGSLSVTRTADPRAGDTFLIIDKSQNRALAGRDGQAILEDVGGLGPEEPVPRNWQWLCTERDGFKGFQNVATRGFLGHDIWWNFEAKVPHHKWWEYVVLSRHEGGYYWIQFLDGWVLWQFSAKPDGRGVFAQRDGGTLWEFIKVHVADA